MARRKSTITVLWIDGSMNDETDALTTDISMSDQFGNVAFAYRTRIRPTRVPSRRVLQSVSMFNEAFYGRHPFLERSRVGPRGLQRAVGWSGRRCLWNVHPRRRKRRHSTDTPQLSACRRLRGRNTQLYVDRVYFSSSRQLIARVSNAWWIINRRVINEAKGAYWLVATSPRDAVNQWTRAHV